MKFGLTLVILASLALGQDCDTKQTCESAGDAVATARKDLRIARTEFKRLTRFERAALGDARETYFKKSAHGQTLAPMFAGAADALHAAAQDKALDKKIAKLVRDASDAYRDLARALDGKKSHAPAKPAATPLLAKWEKVATKKPATEAAAAWKLMKKGDPRLRAMAANLKAISDSLALAKTDNAHVAGARKLTAALVKHFDGVPTARPAKPVEATQAPT